MYNRGFIHALTRGQYRARAHTAGVARRMISSLGGGDIALSLVKQLRLVLATQSVRTRHAVGTHVCMYTDHYLARK